MKDREYLVAIIQRVMTALGIAGTLVGLLGSGTPGQALVGVILLSTLILLVGLDLLYHFIPWGIPWRKVRRGIAILIKKLTANGFASPDVVIGFGRAGSVIGATLAANLGRRPFIALDIQHEYVNGVRRVIVNGPIKLNPEELHEKKILLVSAYVHEFETFNALLEHLKSLEIKNSRLCHATLFIHPNSIARAPTQVSFEYAFKEVLNSKRWKTTPWHIRQAYTFR